MPGSAWVIGFKKFFQNGDLLLTRSPGRFYTPYGCGGGVVGILAWEMGR